MNRLLRFVLPGLASLGLGGCGATVHERHHFAMINGRGEVANIFRVKVDGRARQTNARYIAGFYDERAVDLFFNESQLLPLDDKARGSGAPSIFRTVDCAGLRDADCRARQDQSMKMVPVGSDAGKKGRFVMILSTNADAIANTIGSFAQNDTVMNSVMFLATRAEREEAAQLAASADGEAQRRAAVNASIAALAGLPAANDPARTAKWLAVLQTLADSLGGRGVPRFTGKDQAIAWFDTFNRQVQQ